MATNVNSERSLNFMSSAGSTFQWRCQAIRPQEIINQEPIGWWLVLDRSNEFNGSTDRNACRQAQPDLHLLSNDASAIDLALKLFELGRHFL